MNHKYIVSKDLLKRIAVDIARVLLNIKVDRAEIIETEFQRIEDRRADWSHKCGVKKANLSCISKFRTATTR